jgi:hypothetical protein
MARGDRSVDVFVRKLRQKLEKSVAGLALHPHALRVGYRFAPEPAVGEGTAPGRSSTRCPPRALPRRIARDSRVSGATVSLTTARNVGIVLLLAAGVAFIPGGGTTAAGRRDPLDVDHGLARVLRLSLLPRAPPRARRLGDRWRGLLYGAIGVVVLALAALPRLQNSSGGTLVVIVLLGGAAFAFYAVWRHYREYA